MDGIKKARNDIIAVVCEELGVSELEGIDLKEVFVKNVKDELGIEGINRKLGNFEKTISGLRTGFCKEDESADKNLETLIKDEVKKTVKKFE